MTDKKNRCADMHITPATTRKPANPPAPEKNDALSAPVSSDLDTALPVTPVESSESSRVPGTRRQRQFERQVQKAKRAIQSGAIEPKARPVSVHCQCAYRTALSILAVLTEQGVIERHGRGWRQAA